MIKSPIQFVYVCVCRNTHKKLRVFVGFVDFKFKFCCEFRSWMFLNHSKLITSCFDGLNIPSYLAYSTFLVITNRDFYGLIPQGSITILCLDPFGWYNNTNMYLKAIAHMLCMAYQKDVEFSCREHGCYYYHYAITPKNRPITFKNNLKKWRVKVVI